MELGVGRPSKYKPEYCVEIIEFMAQGYSATGFAGHIGVGRNTIYEWAKQHPDFHDALKTAQAAAVKFWEELLTTIGKTNVGNATAAIFALKNRAADDWRDKQEHGITDKHGNDVSFQVSLVPAKKD